MAFNPKYSNVGKFAIAMKILQAESMSVFDEDTHKDKGRENNQYLPIILKLIKNAQQVFFLGFGFADENLEILGIPETIENKLVYGTAMGFTETETKRVLHKLKRGELPDEWKKIPAKINKRISLFHPPKEVSSAGCFGPCEQRVLVPLRRSVRSASWTV